MSDDNKFIRSKTHASGGLTENEKAAMKILAQEWTAIALRTDKMDRKKAEPLIQNLYKAADLPIPEVVFVDSPMQAAFTYGAKAALIDMEKDGSKLMIDKERSKRIHDALFSALPEVEAMAAYQCFEQSGFRGIEEANKWSNHIQGGNMWTGEMCYIAAVRDVLGLDLPEFKKYKAWEQAGINSGPRILHNEFCVVSDFPELILTDNENRPHAEHGPSHKWRDGWKLYHWHGHRIPEEWIENREMLTAEFALKQTNVEDRRVACEIIGWANIIDQLNPAVIDKDNDPEVGSLVEVMLEGVATKFLMVRCGTGRDFALPVDDGCNTAFEAQAWIHDTPADEFVMPEIRT